MPLHHQCDCCHSWHVCEKRADGAWWFRCDWAKTEHRLPPFATMRGMLVTPPSRAEREGGALARGLRAAGKRAEPRIRRTPGDWLRP